jgi:endonuclease/exonuclease/phosphatase family metal-dependent hydrolase
MYILMRLGILLLLLSLFMPGQAGSGDLSVMSFNIRYGTAEDGDNHWNKRKDFLIETIRSFNPDLLGTQETLSFQRDYIAGKLTEYDVLGVGRDDGLEGGEMMALYFKRSRFTRLGGGHFWLSETPDQAGSKSWDSSLPRMVTWVRLQDRQNTRAKPIVFLNTHFDHRGLQARLESAKLVRRRVDELSKENSVIVTGDFNTGEGSDPYKALFGLIDGRKSPLRDTYRVAHPARSPNEGTFSDFKASTLDGPRIDWIAVSDGWKVVTAEIDRTSREARTPSDHFAVTAVLRLP